MPRERRETIRLTRGNKHGNKGGGSGANGRGVLTICTQTIIVNQILGGRKEGQIVGVGRKEGRSRSDLGTEGEGHGHFSGSAME